jgi:hypothetical protein
MILTAEFFCDREQRSARTFWPRLLKEEELQRCDPLEKLLAGWGSIVALDAADLLAA